MVQDYHFDKTSGQLVANQSPKKIGVVTDFSNSNLTDKHPPPLSRYSYGGVQKEKPKNRRDDSV